MVTAYDTAGRVVPDPMVGGWTSSDESVAPITQSGLVTALRPGTTTIAARVQGFTATATVDVWADWGYDLVYDAMRFTGPALFALDLREPAGEGHPILAEGSAASDPTPSPDGTRIAFVVRGATSNAIYLASRNGSDVVRLTAETGFADQPAWSPDGARLAFRYRPDNRAPHDIWVIDADGRNAASLTADMGDASSERDPAWSATGPNGSRIAFVRPGGGGTMLVWSMRPDGTGKRRVTYTETQLDEAPAWSPDGTRLVFLRDGNLWLVSEAGGDERRLIALNGTQRAPAWSPDGRLIAFASTHEWPTGLYTVRADGTGLVRRASGDDYFGNVAWRVRR